MAFLNSDAKFYIMFLRALNMVPISSTPGRCVDGFYSLISVSRRRNSDVAEAVEGRVAPKGSSIGGIMDEN